MRKYIREGGEETPKKITGFRAGMILSLAGMFIASSSPISASIDRLWESRIPKTHITIISSRACFSIKSKIQII
jgi:hypothetical protein